MVNIILSLILAYLCAYAYRFGGCSKEFGRGAAIGLTLTLISILVRFGWLKLGVG